jgi:sialate O-acetylesterase
MFYRLCSLAALFALVVPVSAQGNSASTDLPFLSPLFSDNMVLQRDHEDPVWGWTTPGAKVTVQFAGKTTTATAGLDGKWAALVGPLPAGGPYTMDISGPQTVHLSNVLIGDVWLCGGQSNMEVSVSMMKNGKEEVAGAGHPDIRLFLVERAWASSPQATLNHQEHWNVCSPQTITQGGWNGFSAVAYYFGRALQKKVNVPIGLIQSCWSATKAESWTSAPTLAAMPDFADVYQRLKVLDGLRQKVAEEHETWCDTNDPAPANYREANFSDNSWRRVNLPELWADQTALADYTGIVWLRKEIDLPASAVGKSAVLSLGNITESDTVWVNGERIGAGAGPDAPCVYAVPADALRAGKNVIAIRVLNLFESEGGVVGKPSDMRLDTGDGHSIALAGGWRYKETDNINRLISARPVWGVEDQASQLPATLYNAMIAPIIPYEMAGVAWYQGESNTPNAQQYETLLPAMIAQWRKDWGEGDFPFYIVQIANFNDTDPSRRGHWAALREAQAVTASTVSHSGLVVTIDIGDPGRIHPLDKQEVGDRLALVALANYYHKNEVYSGPVYRSMKPDGDKIQLLFDDADGGLTTHGRELTGFEIAGGDRKFVPAKAQIEGDAVIVSAPSVKDPVAVRYGWADSPTCNLYNGAGLPAAPFRTDNWPL